MLGQLAYMNIIQNSQYMYSAKWEKSLWQDLTHLPLDKMATILADNIFKHISLNEKDRTLMQISQKFVPRSPIDNKPALVQVVVWCRTSDKPLPELLMTQSTDAYMWH